MSRDVPLPKYELSGVKSISASLASFQLKLAVFNRDNEVGDVQYFKLQQKCGNSGENEGFDHVWCYAITEIWDFKSFSAILTSFQLKMAGFGRDNEASDVQHFKLQQKCGNSG